MRNFRKIAAMFMAVIMVLSLAACGKTETSPRGAVTTPGADSQADTADAGKSSTVTADKPIELVVYSQLANFSGEQQGWAAKLLLDKFNVKITIIPETEGVFDTRMEAGNLGDIVVFGSTGNDYQRAVKGGMLLDWNKYGILDNHGTYIRDNMASALQSNRNLTSKVTDGASDALYGFGHSVASSSDTHEEFFYTWDVRWDLYKELGYPVVKDIDDLVTLFEQMKQICPKDELGNETYALSIWPDWDGSMVMYPKSFATAFWGYDEMCLGLYDPDTGTMHDALEENGPYLQAVKFLNTLYQKGLLDPNSMTQTYDGMIEKLKVGGAFFSIFNYSGSLGYNTLDHLQEGKYMYTMVPEEAAPLCYGMSPFGGIRVWTIGAYTEYPELCMDIINWLCTPDGYMEITYGPKDVMWYYDEDGRACFTEFGRKCNADKQTPMTEEEAGIYAGGTFHDGECQINNTTWSMNEVNPNTSGDTYNADTWRSVTEQVEYDIQKDWISYNGCSSIHDYMEKREYKVAPATEYSEPAKSAEFNLTWNQVTKCIVEYTWKAIYAKNDQEFNFFVNEMIKKANAYGYEECKQWSIDEAAKRHALEDEVRGK